jgi:NhaP-type Na+/H+ or K+/H+ antiporter
MRPNPRVPWAAASSFPGQACAASSRSRRRSPCRSAPRDTAFPYRELIVVTAFAVVVGTLVVQGLTLKPLMRALHFDEEDTVAREVEVAR